MLLAAQLVIDFLKSLLISAPLQEDTVPEERFLRAKSPSATSASCQVDGALARGTSAPFSHRKLISPSNGNAEADSSASDIERCDRTSLAIMALVAYPRSTYFLKTL
jgi:hypothetical protein